MADVLPRRDVRARGVEGLDGGTPTEPPPVHARQEPVLPVGPQAGDPREISLIPRGVQGWGETALCILELAPPRPSPPRPGGGHCAEDDRWPAGSRP